MYRFSVLGVLEDIKKNEIWFSFQEANRVKQKSHISKAYKSSITYVFTSEQNKMEKKT